MRNSIKIIVFSALSLAACQKENVSEEDFAQDQKIVNFISEEIETKTAFGTPVDNIYPTLWTSNDSKIKINVNGSTPSDAIVAPAEDGKSAKFTSSITDPGSTSYVFRALSPSSSYVGYKSTEGWNVEIPTTQTPTLTSVDEKAQIIAAKSDSYSTFPTETIPLHFSHVTSYGKITIKDLDSKVSSVSKITLTAEENWAGRYYYNDGKITENSASSVITIFTSNLTNVWFACAPVELKNKKLTITVTTDKGDYTRSVTFPQNFEAGKIKKFSVTFADVAKSEDVVYTKVTSTDELTVGSKVIIASGSYALGTTQNENNRAAASVTVTDNTVINPNTASVQVLTIARGAKDETIGLYTGSSYLCSASSTSNYLKTQSTLDANGSFSVTFDKDFNIELKSSGDFTHNIIRYYSNSSIFSCYSTGQSPIQLYKENDSGTSSPALITTLGTPIVSVETNTSDKQISVSWEAVEGATTYFVKCGDQTQTAQSDVSSCTFNLDDYGTYQVTVIAQGDDHYPSLPVVTSVVLSDPNAVEYKLTITPNDFTTGSYADNNKVHTSTAVATNDELKTMEVKWSSNQVQQNGGNMRFQSGAGFIYNLSSLGNISSIVINSESGSFTVYYGTSEQPASETPVGNGYFTIKVGNATGIVSQIVITFNK